MLRNEFLKRDNGLERVMTFDEEKEIHWKWLNNGKEDSWIVRGNSNNNKSNSSKRNSRGFLL